MSAQLKEEMKKHLQEGIIPFWKKLRDDEFGGFYGFVGNDLVVDKKATKGCILNSRITWFFANAYMTLGDESLLDEARHGYLFLRDHCLDKKNGGIYWSISYDGTPLDTTKHTYNQAFCIYALAAYYEASKDNEALQLAKQLFELIEAKCTDEIGYLEAFTMDFKPASNEKLSENGVMAQKTMNTLLHVLEAYTQLYKVSGEERIKDRLIWILEIIKTKIYNKTLHRQEVFFDEKYHSIIDLHSYGHDIETAWLVDRTLEIIGDSTLEEQLSEITRALTKNIYEIAFDGNSLANECDKGVVNEERVWWVQAEAVVGFLNGYEKTPENKNYLLAAEKEWEFIKKYVIDERKNSEWFWSVSKEGKPDGSHSIVGPWKCPYHNSRMCIEVINRMK